MQCSISDQPTRGAVARAEPHIAGEQRRYERGDACEQSDSGCESIHAVDESDGVYAADKPNGGEQSSVCHPCGDGVSRDNSYPALPLSMQAKAAASRPGELLPRFETEEVVEQTGDRDSENGGEEANG